MDVTIEVIHHDEDQPVHGDIDDECAAYIKREIADGNAWAWCMIEVKVTVGSISASSYLGGCSYSSEEEFRADSYYPDMVREAIESLRARASSMRDDAVAALAVLDARVSG